MSSFTACFGTNQHSASTLERFMPLALLDPARCCDSSAARLLVNYAKSQTQTGLSDFSALRHGLLSPVLAGTEDPFATAPYTRRHTNSTMQAGSRSGCFCSRIPCALRQFKSCSDTSSSLEKSLPSASHYVLASGCNKGYTETGLSCLVRLCTAPAWSEHAT